MSAKNSTGLAVRFTSSQRERLFALKICPEQMIVPEQISQLEEILPICRALLRKPATMTAVRDNLADVAKGLRRAYRIAAGQSFANTETRNRLEFAAAEAQLDPLSSPDVLTLLRHMSEVAESALRALPRTQRRDVASPLPIERIERALLQGFIEHYRAQSPAPLPRYMLRTSVTKRPFPDIVAIVYEAIGGKCEPPERAIRTYIKLKKRRKPRGRITVVAIDTQGNPTLLPTSPVAGISADGPFCLLPRHR